MNAAQNERVAVLGTGIMGSAMARNLIAAGLATTVWDRSPRATAPLAQAGAHAAPTAADAVADASAVIMMLPTAEVVTAVLFDSGVAQALASGAVCAQMGTIGVAPTLEISARLGRVRPDVMFVDAPVSGSKGPAEAGQLLILASGPAAAEPVVGEAIAGGPLDAPIADAKLHKMEVDDFAPEFPPEWALKDVDLVLAEAGIAPPLMAALAVQWRSAVDAGHGREDVSPARLALGGPST